MSLHTAHEDFLEDAKKTFGDRLETFSESLKALLFELWLCARTRPVNEERIKEIANAEAKEVLFFDFEMELINALRRNNEDLNLAFKSRLEEVQKKIPGIDFQCVKNNEEVQNPPNKTPDFQYTQLENLGHTCKFPYPRPLYDSFNPSCLDIQIFADDEKIQNFQCAWINDGLYVTHVTLPNRFLHKATLRVWALYPL